MKRLITFTAAAALIAAPGYAFGLAENLPASRQNEWTKAAPLPFKPTPEDFKAFVNSGEFGMQVLKAEQCELIDSPAKVLNSPGPYGRYDIWSPDIDKYECNRTFYEIKDPRGTQRCMGMVSYRSMGTTPKDPSPSQKLNQKTLKNDCRWL